MISLQNLLKLQKYYLNENICSNFCYENILNIPLAFYNDKQSGYIISRVNEIDTLYIFFSPLTFKFIINSIRMIGAIILINIISWKIFLISLVFIPVYYFITNLTSTKIKKSSSDLFESLNTRSLKSPAILLTGSPVSWLN